MNAEARDDTLLGSLNSWVLKGFIVVVASAAFYFLLVRGTTEVTMVLWVVILCYLLVLDTLVMNHQIRLHENDE